MTRYLYIILNLILAIFTSCSSSSTNNSRDKETETIFPEFNNFPERQYLEIQLGQSTLESEKILIKNGFQLITETGSKLYTRTTDSTEVFLPNSADLFSFKVFIKNHHYLSKNEEFESFFGKNAQKTEKNGSFSVFSYSYNKNTFQLTIFSQKDFLRLNFLLKSKE